MLRKYLQVILIAILIICNITNSSASNGKKSATKYIAPIQTGLVFDVHSGKMLHAKNPKAKIHPASLTKWMTLYLVFDAIDKGRLHPNQKIYISEHAAKMPPCKMGLPAGDFITVRAAISALIVGSHNDISVALAEATAGSEQRFAALMTKTARQLGMKDSMFKNASGLHDSKQITTALDLIKLSLAIKRDHPKYYALLGQTSFAYRGKIYNGHNYVMKNYKYAKASKTGFTNPSGYNLITHAATSNKNIIAVVTGHKTAAARNNQMLNLLDKHLGVKQVQNPNKKQVVSNRVVKVASANVAKKKTGKKLVKNS